MIKDCFFDKDGYYVVTTPNPSLANIAQGHLKEGSSNFTTRQGYTRLIKSISMKKEDDNNPDD